MLSYFSLAILFFLSTSSPARAAPGRVIDTDGKQLEAGSFYFVLPAIADNYGGLSSWFLNGTKCPLAVTQAPAPMIVGKAVTFTSVDGRRSIRLSTDVNVDFRDTNICPEKSIWTLAKADKATGKRFVTYGGVAGNPGPATVNNWFKIEKEGDHYKLVFCPSVCKTCKGVACGDIGVYRERANSWLVLGSPALPVKFRKY